MTEGPSLEPTTRPSSGPVDPGLSLPATTADAEYRHGGWRELFANRRFLLLQGTGASAGAGYAVYSVSVLFLAYGLTGNLVIAGLVLFIEYGVYTLTFLVAPLVDRARDKRTILLACYPVQASAAVTLAVTLRTGTLTTPLLLGLVFVLAVMWDFVWAVLMIAPPLVLPKRLLFAADGFSNLLSIGTQVGGYAGGGALLYVVGPYGGASAYAVLLASATIFALPLALPVDHPPDTRFWETLRRGWDSFRGSAGRALRSLAAVDTFLGFFAALPPLLIPAIAYQRFADPAAVYGPLVTAYALGGSFAGIAVGQWNPRRQVGRLLVLTPLLGGLGVLALDPFSVSAWAVGGLLAGVGAAYSVRYSAKYSWVQGSYPSEALGRLVSNLYLFTGVSGTIAVLLVGSLSTALPLVTLELLTGLGLVVGGLLAFASRPIRTMAF